jgi:hypothetical protein
MPNGDASVASGTYFLFFAVVVAGSFLVTYLSTDLGRMRRAPYVALLTLAAGVMTWLYLWWTGTEASTFLRTGWGWGILGGVLAGSVTAFQARRWPAMGRVRGPAFLGKLAWEGLVYGATEGMLLSILPVLTVWQGGRALGWTDGWPGRVGVGTLAIAASVVVIAVHHFGYREFRGSVVRYPIMACGLFSLAYLLTGSVIAAVGGHIVLHIALIARGSELPPHRGAIRLDRQKRDHNPAAPSLSASRG